MSRFAQVSKKRGGEEIAAGKAKDGKMNVSPSRANTGYTPRPGPAAPMGFTPSRRRGDGMTSLRGSEVPETGSSDLESSSRDVKMEDVGGWEKVAKKGKKEKSPKKGKKSKVPRKEGKVVKTGASKEDPLKVDDSDGSGDDIVVSSKEGKFEEIPRQKIKPRPVFKDAPVDRSPSRVVGQSFAWVAQKSPVPTKPTGNAPALGAGALWPLL